MECFRAPRIVEDPRFEFPQPGGILETESQLGVDPCGPQQATLELADRGSEVDPGEVVRDLPFLWRTSPRPSHVIEAVRAAKSGLVVRDPELRVTEHGERLGDPFVDRVRTALQRAGAEGNEAVRVQSMRPVVVGVADRNVVTARPNAEELVVRHVVQALLQSEDVCTKVVGRCHRFNLLSEARSCRRSKGSLRRPYA